MFGVHLAVREAMRAIVLRTTSGRTYTNRETHMTRHRDAELGQFIPLHYHYNMLNDTARMRGFKAAIEHAVRPGACVLELGGGTGVLSYFAAQKASKVWCVERNPELAHTARAILALNRSGHKVVVICEMNHVAMLREKQIPVISAFKQRYLEKFGGPLPLFIPEALIQAVQPVEQSFEFEGYFAPTILFQDPAAMQPKTRELAAPAVYQLLSYEHELPRHCTSNGTIRIEQAGSLNALRFITKNILAIDAERQQTIDWHSQYLILPLAEPLAVAAGDEIYLDFSYEAGADFAAFRDSIAIAHLRAAQPMQEEARRHHPSQRERAADDMLARTPSDV